MDTGETLGDMNLVCLSYPVDEAAISRVYREFSLGLMSANDRGFKNISLPEKRKKYVVKKTKRCNV